MVATNAQKPDPYEEVLAEYFKQIDTGIPVDAATVIERHPEFAARLKRFFRDLDLVNGLVESAIGVDDESFSVPETISRHRIRHLIGHGGFGKVFLAHDTHLNRQVAIKIPHPHRMKTPQQRQRFVDEGRLLASMQHPAILSVYEAGEVDELCYLVTEYIDGDSLSDRLKYDSIDFDSALEIAMRVTSGLHAAHEQGIVHRDLKPANVLLAKDGRVRISDFGLALTLIGDVSGSDQPAGTPRYIAPESLHGSHPIDRRSDLWSFGIMLHELFFEGDPIRDEHGLPVLEQIGVSSKPTAERIRLKAIIRKCLHPAPEDRYATAAEVENALRAVATLEQSRRRRRKRAARVAVCGLLLITVALGFVDRYIALDVSSMLAANIDSGIPSFAKLPLVRSRYETKLEQRLAASQSTDSDASSRFKIMTWLAAFDPTRLHELLHSVGDATVDDVVSTRSLLEQLEELDGQDYVSKFLREVRQLYSASDDKGVQLRFAAVLGHDQIEPPITRFGDAPSGPMPLDTDALFDAFVAESIESVSQWAQLLQPFSQPLCDRLKSAIVDEDPSFANKRPKAILGYVILASNAHQDLARALQHVHGHELAGGFQEAIESNALSLADLRSIHQTCVTDQPPPDCDEFYRARLAEANAVLLLAKNGEPSALWEGLRFHDYPNLRSELIDRAHLVGLPLELWMTQLEIPNIDPHVASALVKILANYASHNHRFEPSMIDTLTRVYAVAEHPAVHYATGRLLGILGELPELEPESPEQALSNGRRWYRSPSGLEFSILPPGHTVFGPSNDFDHQVEVFIPRTIAVSTTEITRKRYKDTLFLLSDAEDHDDVLPAVNVPIIDALRFCNELSRQEGIPPSQWCYEVLNDGHEDWPFLQPAPDILEKTGYRLLTLSEWEYACRAGTRSKHWAGYSAELLNSRAKYRENMQTNPFGPYSPVGTLHPNEFGLFNLLGNAPEWNQSTQIDAGVLDSIEKFPPSVDQDFRVLPVDHPAYFERNQHVAAIGRYVRSTHGVYRGTNSKRRAANFMTSGLRIGRTIQTSPP